MKLNNKVVIVTGGLGGIGLYITKILASEGYKVYATYKNKTNEEVQSLKNSLPNPSNIKCVYLDITNFKECEVFYDEILKSEEKIYALINNAGITSDASFKKMTSEQWHTVLHTNLYSLFNTTKIPFTHMLEQKTGCIVNISSVNALKGQFGQANYCAAKAGIIGFTKALAQEGAKYGVRVNVIAPGYTNTDMVRLIPTKILEEIKKTIPMGKLIEPSEIAYAVNFLLSDSAVSITGETISINAGMYMK